MFKAVLARTDDRNPTLGNNLGNPKGIQVIGSVGNHDSGRGVSGNQCGSLRHVMAGARRQDKTQRKPKGITHGSIEFRRKASVAPTECLSCLPSAFFSRHPLRRHAHARPSNQRGAHRFHRHHGNVHGVFQRPPHRTIGFRSVDK